MTLSSVPDISFLVFFFHIFLFVCVCVCQWCAIECPLLVLFATPPFTLENHLLL
jgi:hypothetical protein